MLVARNNQFRNLVIRPALRSVGLHSQAAENLLLGTALQESNLFYLKQVGGGPALGFYQMEPFTARDICYRYVALPGNKNLAHMLSVNTWPHAKVHIPYQELTELQINNLLVTDLVFQTIMCRLKYHMIKEKLPKADDLPGLANYWKKYYNTEQGRGKPEEFILNYGRK